MDELIKVLLISLMSGENRAENVAKTYVYESQMHRIRASRKFPRFLLFDVIFHMWHTSVSKSINLGYYTLQF